MYLCVKIITLIIILPLIAGKLNVSTNASKSLKTTKNEKLSEENVEIFNNKSIDLLTSDQNYNYVSERDSPFGTNHINKDKSFLREIHYFRNREFGYEKNYDWDSDSDRELKPKKVKKDLYNKRNYGKNYEIKDMIEAKKWDDNQKDVHFDYNVNDMNNKNDINNNDYNENKREISYELNIKHNNDNNEDDRQRSAFNKDNNNYIRKHSFEDRSEDPKEYGTREDSKKWFTNMEDTDRDNSNEVRDEDNYNNFNSPKFLVNFHKFKPWDRLMGNRRIDDNYNTGNSDYENNQNNNYEIYSKNRRNDYEDESEDQKTGYKPKLLTDLRHKIKTENNLNNNYYKNYNKNPMERDVRWKTTVPKETPYRMRNRPQSVRYHYEKRVPPQSYSTSGAVSDYPRSRPYYSRDDMYTPMKYQKNRRFIEMPYDMLNTGWSSVHKTMRHRSDGRTAAEFRQYRYGF